MRTGRDGFTLVELLVVTTIIGILAGIALPRLRTAIDRADASRVMAEMTTIRTAVISYLEEEGSVPRNGRWGQVPPGLEEFLPDGYAFSYKDAEFRWRQGRQRGNLSGTWGAIHIRYPRASGLSAAMRTHRGPNTLWNSRRTIFLIPR